MAKKVATKVAKSMAKTVTKSMATKVPKVATPAVAAPAAPPAAAPAVPPALPPAPEGMMNVFVDGVLLHVKRGSTVMQACTLAEKEIPHFCYHERLSVAGNCRMCLVEVEGMPKPIASCHWPAAEGMKIKTDSKLTQEARKGTMELLLINHPLDCPICDQGGECDLQDQAVAYGSDRSHYHEFKRAVDDKEIGGKIKTVMTRCIHCTRCVRFATEIAGVEEFGATGRGENMQIGTYVEAALQSELAGNMIDLCPVGALTSKPYAYTARPWELVRSESVDVLDAVGTPITVDTRSGEVMRVLPRENAAINEEWLSDAARFSYDALKSNRLTVPMVRKGKQLVGSNWPEAFAAVVKGLRGCTKHQVGGLMGDMQGAEDAYAFKAFLRSVVGTDHVDCRHDGSVVNAAVPAGYSCNTPFGDWDKADVVLLVGVNPRLEAPVLNVRLRRLAVKGRVPVAAVGEACDLTYPVQWLDNTPATLEDLVSGKHPFAKVLKAAQRPLVVVGMRALAGRSDEAAVWHSVGALAEKYAAKKATESAPAWDGLNVLAPTVGRVTALDMAVVPSAGGHAAAALVKAAVKGDLKVVFVYGAEGPTSLVTPEAVKTMDGLTVYVGTHLTDVAKACDVLLPSAAWAEKAMLLASAEGRVQATQAAVPPPLQAKEDWKIWRALSGELGAALPFNTLGQLREKLAAEHPAFDAANWGKVVPAARGELGKAGKLLARGFGAPVGEYYLQHAYLAESAVMQGLQGEVGTAEIRGKKKDLSVMPDVRRG